MYSYKYETLKGTLNGKVDRWKCSRFWLHYSNRTERFIVKLKVTCSRHNTRYGHESPRENRLVTRRALFVSRATNTMTALNRRTRYKDNNEKHNGKATRTVILTINRSGETEIQKGY